MRSLERQAARRQTYAVVAMVMVVVFGVVAIFMLLGATKRKSRKMYEDPVIALRDIFARQETLYRMKHGRYATLAELLQEGVISDEILEGPVQGFLYKAAVIEKDRFEITAEPKGPPPAVDTSPEAPKHREIPRRFYSVDESHTVRSDTAPISSVSPVIWSPRDSGFR